MTPYFQFQTFQSSPQTNGNAEVDQKKVDNITELFGKCFDIQVSINRVCQFLIRFQQSPADATKPELECIESKSDDDDTESETKLWQYATQEIESIQSDKGLFSTFCYCNLLSRTAKKSTVNTDIILNTGADDDFGTVIRRPRNNDLLTPPESKDSWNIEVQSNPVVDEQVRLIFYTVSPIPLVKEHN